MKLVMSNGTIKYFNDEGKLHREDGPAVIYPDGTKFWYVNGHRHRLDGPAIIRPYQKRWYVNGQRVNRFMLFLKRMF